MKTISASPIFFILFASLILQLSCENVDPNKSNPISKESIQGYVQKGPFLNGTSINVAELNSDLVQTGKNFTTQISDNRGSFELKQLELSSQFVEIKADGFYYNEVSDIPSSARLILYALSDLTDKNSLNVNLMSHLERERVFHLISEGYSFQEAKKQAQQEVLRIFSIEKSDIQESELLDISREGEDHAILLAISLILQGHRSVAELSELLANISIDLKEDGELNNTTSGSALINHAGLLKLDQVRDNLEGRLEETGLTTILANFEKYVDQFLQNSDFEVTSFIEYPEFSNYGENILYGDRNSFIGHEGYSLAANLPAGSHISIRLTCGSWHYQVMPNGPVNWNVSEYDDENRTQLFKSIESGKACDLIIQFSPPFEVTDSITMQDSIFNKYVLIEYFENQSDTATRTKVISIEEL